MAVIFATYSPTGTTATQSTGWIFGKYDPGVEYRTKPGEEDIIQVRRKVTYVRYRFHFGAINFSNQEGRVYGLNFLDSSNGLNITLSPTGSEATNALLVDHTLENEGGQGSGMFKETEVWDTFSNYSDMTTDDVTTQLGVTPF